MRTTIVRMNVREGMQAAFEAAAKIEVDRVLKMEPRTILYSVLRNPDDPSEITFLETFEDEDAVNHHVADVQKFWGLMMETFLARPNQRERFEQEAIVTATSKDCDWIEL